MMPGLAKSAFIAIAALLAACARAPTDAKQPEAVGKMRQDQPISEDVEQIAPSDGGDKAKIEDISRGDGGGVEMQQPEGRDLCAPGVSAARRRAAGVDCDVEIKPEDESVRTTTGDPLLEGKQQDIEKDFEALGLGKDVPATVILQQ